MSFQVHQDLVALYLVFIIILVAFILFSLTIVGVAVLQLLWNKDWNNNDYKMNRFGKFVCLVAIFAVVVNVVSTFIECAILTNVQITQLLIGYLISNKNSDTITPALLLAFLFIDTTILNQQLH